MRYDQIDLSALLERWRLSALVLLAAPCFCVSAASQPILQAHIATDLRPITVVDGDDIAFSRVENAEEFSQSRVAQIAQDDRGFMWFGTQYGLIRFDGYGHTVFAPDARAPNRLSGVFVHAMRKDSSGRLWVASDQGLDILDPQSGALTHIAYTGTAKISAAIQSIYEDVAGTIWLSTSAGLYGLDSSGRTRVHFHHDENDPASLSSNDVKSAKEDRSGTFWLTTGAGLEAIDRADGRVLIRVPLRESLEMDFIEDRRGAFWIYHAGGNGLATFDRSTNTLTKHRLIVAGESSPRFSIFASLEDRDGGLWFGTSAGLLRHDAERQRFIRYRNNPGDPHSLSDDDIVTLFQDRQDNIWVALHGMPLNVFPARTPSFRKLPSRPGATNARAGKMVNAIFEVDGRSLWISFVGMLLGVDLKTGERQNLSARLRLNTDVISMAQDARGRVWLGTAGGGLVGVDPTGSNVSRFRHDPADSGSIAGDVVNDILVDHAQNLWLATWGGLSRFDERRGRFETYKPQGMDPKYLALAQDDAHQLWLATHLYGLQRFNPVTGEFVSYRATGAGGSLSNGRVNAVHIDRRGIVWAGTQNGLDALDPGTGHIRNYRTDNGLPGNAVSCILEDEQGGIWLGTNNGIARLDARTGEFRSFSRADGLPGLDFTGWGGCHRGGTEMFFAGFAGATAFEPERVRAQRYVPPVEFTDLVIAGRSYPEGFANSGLSMLPEFRELTLPYSQNSVSAGFAALSYTNPMSNRYRFRLAGLEQQWHSVGSDRRVASYNSLAPGNYRLEVQGAISGGPWSATRTLELTILKPWWQTFLFRAAVGALILGLAWLAYRLRVRQVTHQFEIRLEERVAERTRIARELHDSLLQGFHGLMFRLQAVRNLLPMRPQEAAQAFDEALARGDETVEQARLAVTDLRTFAANEPDLETALRAMAHDMPMLSHADAPECRITIEGERRPMVPLVRDDVLQVAREAFRNAVLHAQARLVQVEVSWGEQRFSLRVRDDGVGLDPKLIAQGRDGHWGLQGMRERTRQVGGSLEILSAGTSGTLVELSVPAARAYTKTIHLARGRRHEA